MLCADFLPGGFMKKVLLTGGGTAGHVTPNIALMPYLESMGFEISYMGSYNGVEKSLIEGLGIEYTGIDSGKLRRYLSLQNLKDPFHVYRGFREADRYMKAASVDVVFSKGGFVAVPVVYAAHKNHIPVIIHESDLSPGLANKLCIGKADMVCYSFPETGKLLEKAPNKMCTGLPVRDLLLSGSRKKGLEFCGFSDDKPVLMSIGGSLGSVRVNEAVRASLPMLLEKFNVIHLCGKGKVDESINRPGYVQYEYINEELPDLYAAADIMISRAGSNVIHEIVSLKKPSVLIPLDLNASRGDQIENAQSFKNQGFCEILREADLTEASLYETAEQVYENRTSYIEAMSSSHQANSAKNIAKLIASMVKEPNGSTD